MSKWTERPGVVNDATGNERMELPSSLGGKRGSSILCDRPVTAVLCSIPWELTQDSSAWEGKASKSPTSTEHHLYTLVLSF